MEKKQKTRQSKLDSPGITFLTLKHLFWKRIKEHKICCAAYQVISKVWLIRTNNVLY